MASGCAVVTTTTGVHGIPAVHGRDVMIGKNSEEIAFYATQLLKDIKLRETLAANAQRLVSEKFSWDTIFGQMDGILDEMFPPKPLDTGDYTGSRKSPSTIQASQKR